MSADSGASSRWFSRSASFLLRQYPYPSLWVHVLQYWCVIASIIKSGIRPGECDSHLAFCNANNFRVIRQVCRHKLPCSVLCLITRCAVDVAVPQWWQPSVADEDDPCFLLLRHAVLSLVRAVSMPSMPEPGRAGNVGLVFTPLIAWYLCPVRVN